MPPLYVIRREQLQSLPDQTQNWAVYASIKTPNYWKGSEGMIDLIWEDKRFLIRTEDETGEVEMVSLTQNEFAILLHHGKALASSVSEGGLDIGKMRWGV